MSGTGIEAFRAVGQQVLAADRRVVVDADRNTVQAPYLFAGRIVAWVEGTRTGVDGEQNQATRQAFYDALVKAEGKPFADATILRKLKVDAETFVQDTRALMASDVSDVIGSADRARIRNTNDTVKAVAKFLREDGLTRAAGENPHWQLYARDPALRHELRGELAALIDQHPDYGRRAFSQDDLLGLARQAMAKYGADRQSQFDATFPELARSTIQHKEAAPNPLAGTFHDRSTFFASTRATLEGLGKARSEAVTDRVAELLHDKRPDDTKVVRTRENEWAAIRDTAVMGLEAIEQASKLVADTQTAWKDRADEALTHLEGQIEELTTVRDQLEDAYQVAASRIGFSEEDGTAAQDVATLALYQHLLAEIGHQLEGLEAKQARFVAFQAHDPLSEKNLAYQRLLLAESSHALVTGALDLSATRQSIVTEIAGLDAISQLTDREKFVLTNLKEQNKESIAYDAMKKVLMDFNFAPDGSLKYLSAQTRDQAIEELSNLRFDDLGLADLEPPTRQQFVETLHRLGLVPIDAELDAQTCTSAIEGLKSWGGLTPKSVGNLDDDRRRAVLDELQFRGYDLSLLDLDHGQHRQEVLRRCADLGITRDEVKKVEAKRELVPAEKQRLDELTAELQRLEETEAPLLRRVDEARKAWEGARNDHRVELPTGSSVRAVLDYQLTEERDFVDAILTETLSPGQRSDHGLRSKDLDAKIRGARDDLLVDLAQKTGGIGPIRREMTVSRGGVTHDYGSEMLPIRPTLEEPPANDIDDDIVLVNADVEPVPRSRGEIMLSRLTDEEHEGPLRVLHQSIRFTAPDTSSSEEPMIECNRMASDVLTVAAQQNRRLSQGGDGGGERRLAHVNFHLVTSNHKEQQLQAKQQLDAFDGQERVRLSGVGDDAEHIDAEVISFAFGVNGTSPDLADELRQRDRTSMGRLIGDLASGTSPGGLIGSILERLERASKNEGDDQVDDPEAAITLAKQIRWQADQVRTSFVEEGRSRTDQDSYAVIGHTMRLVDLGERALDMLGDRSLALTQSQGHHGRRDPGCVVDVEVKSQAIIEDLGGRVGFDQPLSRADKAIYSTVLAGSGQDEMERLTTGLPGSSYAPSMFWRSGDREATLRALGMAQRTDL